MSMVSQRDGSDLDPTLSRIQKKEGAGGEHGYEGARWSGQQEEGGEVGCGPGPRLTRIP